jgi:hypothetical protein
MPKSKRLNRRGRRPSLKVAARQAGRIQKALESLVADLEGLEDRLLRLEELMEASRKAEMAKARARGRTNAKGIRGKGPNVRDVAYSILSRRRRPMTIQDLAKQVLKTKKGSAGENFIQNLGAALARDPRFLRVERGTYGIRR